MRIIGLLGGAAAGKSTIAEMFAELGAGVLDADQAAHEALRDPDVEVAIRQRWGDGVFGLDGRVDRGRLGRIVFAEPPDGPRARGFLERLVHPVAARLVEEQARAMASSGKAAAILDAPLLLEAGWDKLCDKLVFVDAPRAARLVRASARGWSEKEFAAREAAQLSLERKRQRADLVIDNSGSPELSRAQVRRAWQLLVG
jgi:dephospho-CoA kinase